MTPAGFPHSEIPGSKRVCRSPGLIAACRVLHRRSAPRHSPFTLSSLAIKFLKRESHKKFAFSLHHPILFSKTVFTAPPRTAEGVRGNPGSGSSRNIDGGADRARTDDLRLAKPPLSQLSYSPPVSSRGPGKSMVGLDRFELSTPRLSSVCSDQLSYRPGGARQEGRLSKEPSGSLKTERRRQTRFPCRPRDGALGAMPREPVTLRKEVIQPQVLLQLPCYDFTPITDHTLSGCVPCGLAHRFLVQPTFVM